MPTTTDYIEHIFKCLTDKIEYYLRCFIIFLTNFLHVKVIRDEKGRPFLYRYHLFSLTDDGPGICIHNFVASDPERGYHDHPWDSSLSFILCGKYEERILENKDPNKYKTYTRNRWTFNYLDGINTFHRVMLEEGKDVWTLFFFQKRSKIWGMITLNGKYTQMSPTIKDQDGGWWNILGKGLGLRQHLDLQGKVIATVDIIIIAEKENKLLLIKRGKDPYKNNWAFPGGRIEQKDKDLIDAAYRELWEETHISRTELELEYIKTVGNSIRDPRGFCITNIYLGKLPKIPETGIRAGDDAIDYEWFDLDNLPEMAFDHKEIMNVVIKKN